MNEQEKNQYREAFFEGVRAEDHKGMQALMKQIVQKHLNEPNGSQDIAALFTGIFDDLFHDIYNKKIDLKRKTRHMLEMLSLPHYRKPYDVRMKLYDDIIENRIYYQRKNKPQPEEKPEDAKDENTSE